MTLTVLHPFQNLIKVSNKTENVTYRHYHFEYTLVSLVKITTVSPISLKMYPDEDPHNGHTHEGTKVSSSLSSDISILGR
jgi:hypothetical protein